MADNRVEQTVESQNSVVIDPAFVRLIVIIVLFTIGATLALFSLALIKDVETLRNVPGLVWNFLCGSPTSADTPALPLMLTISTLFFLCGLVAASWHIYKTRREKHSKS